MFSFEKNACSYSTNAWLVFSVVQFGKTNIHNICLLYFDGLHFLKIPNSHYDFKTSFTKLALWCHNCHSLRIWKEWGGMHWPRGGSESRLIMCKKTELKLITKTSQKHSCPKLSSKLIKPQCSQLSSWTKYCDVWVHRPHHHHDHHHHIFLGYSWYKVLWFIHCPMQRPQLESAPQLLLRANLLCKRIFWMVQGCSESESCTKRMFK